MKLVEVKWADANGAANIGWTAINEIKEGSSPVEVVSVGHLVVDNEAGVIVALSYNPESQTCDSFTFIPRQNIVEVRELVRKRTRGKADS